MEVLAPLDDIEDLLEDERADLKSVFVGGVLQLFMLTQTLFEFCRRRPFLGTCVLAKPVMRILGSWLTAAAVQSSLAYHLKLMLNKYFPTLNLRLLVRIRKKLWQSVFKVC